MTKTISALRDILTLLLKIQESVWVRQNPEPKRSNQALKTYDAIHVRWVPITFEEIEYLFKCPQLVLNFSQWGKVLYLPPLEKDNQFLPILSPYCNFNDQQIIARFRVMLVCLDDCFDYNRKVNGIGFRMETPENLNRSEESHRNEGIHDFYHAQLIQKFNQPKLDNGLQISCPCWIPETQPSFALPANCPVKLLICLVITLYGKKYCKSFFFENNICDIHQHLEELDPWIKWNQD